MIQPIMQRIMSSNVPPRTTHQAELTQYCDVLYWRLTDLRGAAAGEPYVVGITSCNPREGVSTVAANLAISAAQNGGRPALLIDANTSHPSVARRFDVEMGPGIQEALTSDVPAVDYVQRTSYQNLCVLVAGPARQPHYADHYEPTRFSQLLCDLKRTFPIVIVDLPTADELSPCFAMAGSLDGVLLVVEAQRVQSDLAHRVTQRFQQSHANLWGVIVNKED